MRERQQGSTSHPLNFLLVLSSDHLSPATGKTPTVVISKDGGTFAAPAGAVTEVGNGWYSLAGNATDRNTLGSFLLNATASACDPADRDYTIVGYDPFNGQGLGLANLAVAVTTPPTAAAIATAVLTDVSDTLGADVVAIKAKTDNLPAAPASTTNITGGTITTVTNLTNAPTAGDLTAAMKASVTAAVPAYADTSGVTTLLARVGGALTISGGKVAATVAAGDGVDAAAIRATIGVAGAGLTGIPSGDFIAAAVGATSITLDASDPARATSQVGNRIDITGGTLGVGQTGVVTASNTSTGVQTIGAGWSAGVTPTGTVTYELLPPAASGGSGTAQTGDVFALLNPLISAGAITGAALANVPRTGYVLAAAGLDQVAVEAGVNARQALSPILAAAAGVVAGAAGTTVTIKGGNVATTRITATVDADGNRTAVTLALPT